jgi:hypothetical protein
MERTAEKPDTARIVRPNAHDSGIARLDREVLEGVMREDVFRAADGRTLAADPSSIWLPSRRNGRRT